MEQTSKRKKIEIQENAPKKQKAEDLEVTGISRSGRVRKKSSKLMDFESPDDIEARFRKQTPMKGFSYRTISETEGEYVENNGNLSKTDMEMDDGGSGSESDFYDGNMENNDSMDSADSEEGPPSDQDSQSGDAPSAPAHSLYMLEKSTKKKLIVRDGKVVGRAKAQRKDKGKSRVTAYMLWARGARNELLRKYPDMDFSAISKRLGEMWANVNFQERYVWKRKAKRFAMKKDVGESPSNKIISNQSNTNTRPHQTQPVGRPAKPKQLSPTAPAQQNQQTSSGSSGSVYRVSGCGAAEVGAHLRLLGESLAIIGERLKEHEGQIAVSGSVSVLLDTLLCSLAPLLCITRALPAIAPPQHLLQDTLDNIAYIMPGL